MKFLSVVLIGILSLGLGACNGDDSTDEKSVDSEKSAKLGEAKDGVITLRLTGEMEYLHKTTCYLKIEEINKTKDEIGIFQISEYESTTSVGTTKTNTTTRGGLEVGESRLSTFAIEAKSCDDVTEIKINTVLCATEGANDFQYCVPEPEFVVQGLDKIKLTKNFATAR